MHFSVASYERWVFSTKEHFEQWVVSYEPWVFRQKNRRTCFLLSGHRPLYSETANNIFAVTGRHVFLFWFLCLVLFVRAWDYNSCVLFGRCTQRPYPLITQNSPLITHSSPLKTASTVYKTTNLLSDNQKVALSLGRSGRNRYFCNNKPLKSTKTWKRNSSP